MMVKLASRLTDSCHNGNREQKGFRECPPAINSIKHVPKKLARFASLEK